MLKSQEKDALVSPSLINSSNNGLPLVSIVIPNYNNANFLGDAILSILRQTYKHYEIIIVDDGSTDNSRQVVSTFGDEVRYIWQENKGLGGARNTGILAANGTFVGFLDADDQWMPDFLETMVFQTQKNLDTAVFFSNARYMDERGMDLPQSVGIPAIPLGKMYHSLLRANFIIPSTVLVKRSVIIDEGLFDQSCKPLHGCEDWDLWLRIAPRYKFLGIPASLVRYRLHGNTFSANSTHMEEAVRAVVEKHFGPDDGHPQNWSSEKRRAYGGVNRYHVLTSALRKNDWKSGASYLRHAFNVDPTLSADLDLFYELALGPQPIGYRGITDQLDLVKNAKSLYDLLNDVFSAPNSPELKPIKRLAFGTANFALGLVAYNTGKRLSSRLFFFRALYFRPELCRDGRVIPNLVKSFIPPTILGKMRRR
jgi:glycosyltransferase involved in cell wall biosynthesis